MLDCYKVNGQKKLSISFNGPCFPILQNNPANSLIFSSSESWGIHLINSQGSWCPRHWGWEIWGVGSSCWFWKFQLPERFSLCFDLSFGRFKLLMKTDRHFESGLSGFVWVTLPQTNSWPLKSLVGRWILVFFAKPGAATRTTSLRALWALNKFLSQQGNTWQIFREFYFHWFHPWNQQHKIVFFDLKKYGCNGVITYNGSFIRWRSSCELFQINSKRQ